MGVIMKNKVNYTGGGSGGGNANEMTLTMAEYLVLTEEQRMDGTTYYITDGVSTKEIQPVIYSEKEREIGVWTDGKPLYQKTFSISNPPASSVVGVIDVSSLNIEACIIKDGYFKLNDGYSILAINEGFEDRGWCHFYNNEIRYLTKYTATEVVITICYTKNTDTAGSGTWTTDGAPTVHYDGNEKVIGTWFGETLYEKTIDFGALPLTTTKTVAHNIANVDKIWVYDGFVYSTGGIFYQLNRPTNSLTYQWETRVDSTNVTMQDFAAFGNDHSAIITLRYTKTS